MELIREPRGVQHGSRPFFDCRPFIKGFTYEVRRLITRRTADIQKSFRQFLILPSDGKYLSYRPFIKCFYYHKYQVSSNHFFLCYLFCILALLPLNMAFRQNRGVVGGAAVGG